MERLAEHINNTTEAITAFLGLTFDLASTGSMVRNIRSNVMRAIKYTEKPAPV